MQGSSDEDEKEGRDKEPVPLEMSAPQGVQWFFAEMYPSCFGPLVLALDC